MKKRVIFFGDSNSFISSILFQAFLENLEVLSDSFELVAVIDTAIDKQNNKIRKYMSFFIKKIFNPFDRNIKLLNYKNFLSFISDKKYIVVKSRNINDPKFIQFIKSLKCNYAFLMGCPQILKKDIIQCFEKVINYHNSYLPSYRGLEATHWAMTHGEEYTGYTFHYVNENIDDGPIILQERIKLDYSISVIENELIKTYRAAEKISELLQLVSKNFEGIPQSGSPTYFGKKQKIELLTFDNMKVLQRDLKQIKKLIKIWGGIYLHLNNEKLFVTRIGKNGKIERIYYMPPKVYTVYKMIKKIVKGKQRL